MKTAIILFLILTFIACKQTDDTTGETKTTMKFDKQKWMIKDPKTIYAFRHQMLDHVVDSIIATKKSRPLPKQEILDMLGEPTRVDTLHLFYEISMERYGIIPHSAVTLVVKLKEDETVDKVLIAE